MRRLLLILSAIGATAADPSFALPRVQPAPTASVAVEPSALLPTIQDISHGTRQSREEHKYNLWAHGRLRDEVRGLGMSHRR